MCGIIAYAGHRPAVPVVIEGLQHLEYRGYDSAGIAFIQNKKIHTIKTQGKLAALKEKISEYSATLATTAIGHTRWATHGVPAERNAHPHVNNTNTIALVHNGIIENFKQLRTSLEKKNYQFVSETDTEVLVHLISEGVTNTASMLKGFAWALRQLEGAYAIALIDTKNPSTILAARMSAPLILGVGIGENFIASDIPAFLSYTKDVVFLDDSEIISITASSWGIHTLETLAPKEKSIQSFQWDIQLAQKNGYAHFMLKEIFEQPTVIQDVLAGRLQQEEHTVSIEELAPFSPNKLTIVACGSSYHAGLWGKTLLEEYAALPTTVEIASEFRYKPLLLDPEDLIFFISQSGETADTIAALRLAKARGCKTIGICNVVGSTIAREADIAIFTQAGPEVSVASTKAVCSQMVLLAIIASYFAQKKTIDNNYIKILDDLKKLPHILQQALPNMQMTAKQLAKDYAKADSFFFLGRGQAYPLALEGALKLKEVSYIHAEGYAAGELKHGPIALIDDNFPTIALILNDKLAPKMTSNITEIQSRNGPVITIASNKIEPSHAPHSNFFWTVPDAGIATSFILLSAMQLFSYEVAGYLGKDVDQPRNLAKSVTVE